jgi:hypothetical protein
MSHLSDDHVLGPLRAPHFARLSVRDRPAIVRHLTTLDDDSRKLRFGGPTNTEAVAQYVATIDFKRDIVDGVFEDDRLVGVAHLAVYVEDGCNVGELGISISADARFRHVGYRLMSRVIVHALVLRLARVHVLFASRNGAMAHLAQRFTDAIETAKGEAHATIELNRAAA